MFWRRNKWRTDYSNRIPNINLRINKSLLLFLTLVVVIGLLSYFNFTTGSYVKILEENKTLLQENLDVCNEDKQNLTSDLSVCNKDLSSKTSSLETCQSDKNTISYSLSICEEDLGTCEDESNTCQGDLDDFLYYLDSKDLDDIYDLKNYVKGLIEDKEECDDDLDDCKDEKSDLEDDYETLKDNYAEDYCCLLNETSGTITHYSISNNEVSCGTSGTELIC